MTDERHELAAKLRAQGHTQAETAERVGVSPRTIRAWESAGKLSMAALETGSEAEEAEAKAEEPEAGSLFEARRRKELAVAALKELDLAVRRNELMPVEDHLAVVEEFALGVRRWLRSLPGRWPTRLAGEPRAEQAALQGLVGEAYEDLLRYLQPACDPDPHEEEEEADDAPSDVA